MDRDVTYWGPEHRDIDYYHQEEGIREWLKGFQHLAYQETLIDYLRVAMGHLVWARKYALYLTYEIEGNILG